MQDARRPVAESSIAWTLLLLFMLPLAAACGASAQPESPPASSSGSPQAQATTAPGQQGSRTIDACALLSQAEIAAIVGNPVNAGEQYAGPEVCRWDTEKPEQVSVLLTVRAAGSVREQVLCPDLRAGKGSGAPLSGLGDVAYWEFSSALSLFNSGDLEMCGPKGFLSLSLNGQRAEPALKEATLAIARKVLGRL